MPGGRPPQTEPPAFGARLAALRKVCGLTQMQFSERVGVSREMIGYYERRTDNPEASFVVKAANVLGCTTDELLGVGTARNELEALIARARKLPRTEQERLLEALKQDLSSS